MDDSGKTSERDTVKLVQNMLTDQKLRNGKLKEFVQSLLMVEHEEYGQIEKIGDELVDEARLGTRKHE